jgi:hypothetical protein
MYFVIIVLDLIYMYTMYFVIIVLDLIYMYTMYFAESKTEGIEY